jgi:hypothetical protein
VSDDVKGLAGDRRRNPFPSLNETEYALFMATLREEVRAGVTAAMDKYQKANCIPHQEDTAHLKIAVFGQRENGIVGLDEMADRNRRDIEAIQADLAAMADDRKWFKRMVYSALFVAVVGLVIGLVQFAILGK